MTYLSADLVLGDEIAASRPLRQDPRALMAERLPARLQPFLTWLTAKPAPGEELRQRSPRSFLFGALAWILGGVVLTCLGLASGHAAGLLPVFLGLTATCCGLGLFQVVLFHHCSHGTVFRTREANRRAGRLISAFLLFKRFDDYQREHMLHHSANKLLTEEDEFTGFVFGMCRLEPGIGKRELWRRVALGLVSPGFHARFLSRRVQSALLSGDLRHDLPGWAFWAALFGIAAATGSLTWLLVAWVLPVTVLLQVATVFRILCEHRFPDEALIHARGKAFVCASTIGVFPGAMPPAASAATARGLAAWTLWWADMLTVTLFARLFVLVGDAPCHDYHHRRPASRKWTSYAQARQLDQDAGSPGFPMNYTENWGLLHAVDHNLGTLAATPPGLVA
ncbi:fatty acid desaturase [Roseomonas sp. NAR14]|uniref:Fatty acid desaturase n=1 Tax=Roseomonas acroporae TaxID=2937791 RepID=A0A9X1Y599_9PROT|nr:fatty acid desaturase [Roseomonas acroporae]MCK8784489.1 fatty acid desaturase [Roseomonas acroporae]